MVEPTEHDITNQIVDQGGYDPGKFIIERADQAAQARHMHCPMIALDPVEDPDARAALRFYAARAAIRRPQFARDLADLVDGLDAARPLAAAEIDRRLLGDPWAEAEKRLGQ